MTVVPDVIFMSDRDAEAINFHAGSSWKQSTSATRSEFPTCLHDGMFPYTDHLLDLIDRYLSSLVNATNMKTRPDTRQSSRGQLGRSSNAKNTRNFKNISDGRTY